MVVLYKLIAGIETKKELLKTGDIGCPSDVVDHSWKPSPDGGSIAYIWIGATDGNKEGNWLWDGNNDNKGNNFFVEISSEKTHKNKFANWGGTSNNLLREPDNYANQDAAGIGLQAWPKSSGTLGAAGEWNDIDMSNKMYFIIEYDNTTGILNK